MADSNETFRQNSISRRDILQVGTGTSSARPIERRISPRRWIISAAMAASGSPAAARFWMRTAWP
jgi:hypothetical protein